KLINRVTSRVTTAAEVVVGGVGAANWLESTNKKRAAGAKQCGRPLLFRARGEDLQAATARLPNATSVFQTSCNPFDDAGICSYNDVHAPPIHLAATAPADGRRCLPAFDCR